MVTSWAGFQRGNRGSSEPIWNFPPGTTFIVSGQGPFHTTAWAPVGAAVGTTSVGALVGVGGAPAWLSSSSKRVNAATAPPIAMTPSAIAPTSNPLLAPLGAATVPAMLCAVCGGVGTVASCMKTIDRGLEVVDCRPDARQVSWPG